MTLMLESAVSGYEIVVPLRPPQAGGIGNVELYDEDAWVPPLAVPQGSGLEIVDALLDASSPSERRIVVRSALQRTGFEWLGYGRLRRGPGGSVPVDFLTSYVNPSWVTRYFGARHFAVDTRLQDVPLTGAPLVWDEDSLIDTAHSEHERSHMRRLMATLGDCGGRSGLMFALPSARADETVVLSFAARDEHRQWIDAEVIGQALMLGVSLHHFRSMSATPHGARQHGDDAHLSALQREVLRCLQRGLADKQIADQLALSRHGVDYHMRSLRKRFRVRNRLQLVQVAAGVAF